MSFCRTERRPLAHLTALTLLSTIGLGGGCSGESNKSAVPKQVTFGAILPLTGDVANWGEESRQGIDLALEEANRQSTKYRFQVVFEDSKGSGSQAVAAARKLTGVDHVLAIIGDNISGPTLALVPIADAAKVPVLSPSASSPKLSGISPFFFRVYPSDAAEGAFIGNVAAENMKLKRIAVLFINNDFGKGLRDVFTGVFTSHGGTVVESLGYNEDEADFRPYLIKAKRAKPDALYLAGYYKDGGTILRQAKELGIEAQMLGSTTHQDPQLIEIAGDAADGFVYPYSTGFDKDSTARAVTEFQKSFRSKHRKEPGLVTALGYDCAKLLTAAVEAGGADGTAVRTYLADLRDFQGATGTLSFDRNGDVHKLIRLKRVSNGRFIFFDSEESKVAIPEGK